MPTLRAVLEPDARPARWRRLERQHDPEDGGLRFEEVHGGDRDVCGNAGHADAADLDAASVDALLAYLKTL